MLTAVLQKSSNPLVLANKLCVAGCALLTMFAGSVLGHFFLDYTYTYFAVILGSLIPLCMAWNGNKGTRVHTKTPKRVYYTSSRSEPLTGNEHIEYDDLVSAFYSAAIRMSCLMFASQLVILVILSEIT